MEFVVPGSQGFRVSYDSWDDGGGTWFGQDYITQLKQRYQRRWQHCLEWCSGPGFIGFAMLAHDMCDKITFQDCKASLQTHIDITCSWNACGHRVQFYAGDCVDCVPERQFDLVVANPPHYLSCPGDENYQRLAVDQDWKAHHRFFQSISRYLAPEGVIIMQENQAGSLNGVREFWNMIHGSDLEITGYWTSQQYWHSRGPTQIYYIEIKKPQNSALTA